MPQIGGKSAKKTSSSSTKRHFTVVMGNKEHGLYVSSSPSSAARKAVSKLCATDKKRKVQFHIREITQGSKKKTYGPYLGAIEKLKEPIELKGRVIKYKPVAKLSDKKTKTGGGMKKKKTMRGGGEIEIAEHIECTPEGYYIIHIKKEEKDGPIIMRLSFNNELPENTHVIECTYDQTQGYKIKELSRTTNLRNNYIITFENMSFGPRNKNGILHRRINIDGQVKNLREFLSSYTESMGNDNNFADILKRLNEGL